MIHAPLMCKCVLFCAPVLLRPMTLMLTCCLMQGYKDVIYTSILTPAYGGKNTPDHQIFADKCDEDTGRMEGQGEEAEERRELTGTSFQYQRVGHC